uniref:Putative retroelement n=1 Tax=Aureimonas frigidaquae TaxID=424757 RepID=A0A0N7KY61_9HYPH|nr:putative retroelement [Aureimonas frigidaquae]
MRPGIVGIGQDTFGDFPAGHPILAHDAVGVRVRWRQASGFGLNEADGPADEVEALRQVPFIGTAQAGLHQRVRIRRQKRGLRRQSMGKVHGQAPRARGRSCPRLKIAVDQEDGPPPACQSTQGVAGRIVAAAIRQKDKAVTLPELPVERGDAGGDAAFLVTGGDTGHQPAFRKLRKAGTGMDESAVEGGLGEHRLDVIAKRRHSHPRPILFDDASYGTGCRQNHWFFRIWLK